MLRGNEAACSRPQRRASGVPFKRERVRMRLRFAGQMAALGFVALTTANCANPVVTTPVKTGNKYGVAASPKVIPDGQPIPKGGGREMVGKPYVVGERTYVPHEGKGYAREGEASWYGTAFHGRLTANGEVFDKESIAAAHPTLPLPSYVRVTNLNNRRSMIVRVNDRGPYERGRVIDLSERAAEALEFHRAGTTKVRVEYVGRASVKGSDDRKLLATLRPDGGPTRIGPRGPVMLASLDEGGPTSRPLAFKPADAPPGPRVAEIETTKPAARTAPIVVSSRDLGPAPRFQSPPRPEQTSEHPSTRAAPALAAEPAAAKANTARAAERPVRPDRSLDLARIPGATHPTRPAQRAQIAATSPATKSSHDRSVAPTLSLAKSLPPARPVLAHNSAETSRKPPIKAAEKAEPSDKPGRQRVVSLKAGAEPPVR